MRIALVLGATVAALGCVEPNAPRALTVVDGKWDYAAVRLITGTTAAFCKDTGTFTFTRTDSAWTGTARGVSTCYTDGGVISSPLAATISAGAIAANRFTFLTSAMGVTCADTAVEVPEQPTALSGTERCPNSQTTWSAVPGAPVASITLTPTSLVSVPGGTHTIDFVLRVATGQRVFDRPVVWSSDKASVATIAGGTVTAAAVGSATISATVDAKAAATTVTVLAPSSFRAVTAADAYTCALGADQRAYCWGAVRPSPSSTIPIPVQDAPAFTSINGSQHSVCGVSTAQEVWCWGRNESGQLGDGTTDDRSTAARIGPTGQLFTRVVSGGRHSCAISTLDRVWCWGANDVGQLGIPSTSTPSLVPVNMNLTATALSAGDAHTCGIVPGGILYCWGGNARGQVGDGTTTNRGGPVRVSGGRLWVAVSAGYSHTCAVDTGGAAWCWGGNDVGQFGNGTTTGSTVPVPAATGLTLASISSSLNYTCGVSNAAEIWCWGFKGTGVVGQLGDGGNVGSASPVKVTGALSWSAVTTGVYLYSDETTNSGTAAHTCGVTTAGATWCWGSNLTGQLGIGTRADSPVPLKVSGQPQ